MVMENIFRGRALGIAFGLTVILMLIMPVHAASGNRIWQQGMDDPYTWDSHSFAGFYYNLDEDLGTEKLTISGIGRTIDKGHLTYSTAPMEVDFEYSGFGKYQVIGFMADKYFAGYTGNSVISGNKAISTLSRNQLHKVILDDEEKRVINEGGTLTLKEGYVLKMTEVDVSAGPGQIWVTLLKDGDEVDSDVITGRDSYIYSIKLGSQNDVPLLAVHFDSVFRGREVNAAFIRGVFQVSESFTQVKSGDRYGELEISSVSSSGIDMKNRNALSLSSGNTVDLVGDLKIIVADSDTLRFALSVDRTGSFEVRGTIYPTASKWDPMNFGLNIGNTNIGFYYDMNKNVGKETLTIKKISGRSIQEDDLRYTTTAEEVDFDYSKFGSYQVIGFMADKYFAGFTKNSLISNKETISALGRLQLHKVLLDDDTKRTLSEGSTLTLKEGYVLKIKDVDIGAGQGQVLISLLKDGDEVDSDVITGSDNYMYVKNLGTLDEVPIISVHFDTVFRGRETNAAFARGVFQLSESFTSVKPGDMFGAMKVQTVNANSIEMVNDYSIDLSSANTVEVMGNISFKVADSDTLRFYPFVYVTPEMISNQLLIDAPAKATAGESVNVKVTAGGKPVEDVFITINSDMGQTDIEGRLNITLKKTMKAGTYNITAYKLGYGKTSKEFIVQGFAENRLSIDAPATGNQFGNVTIRVLNKDAPVEGAAVSFDNNTIGLTDRDGLIIYKIEESGMHTIYASKSGFATAARDIDVRVPFAEFKALDINANDIVYSNDKVEVRANISNVGTKSATLPVGLIVNSTEIDSISVEIAAGEVKDVTFRKEISLPPGNYSIEILGQKKMIEVREAPFNVFPVLLVIIIIGAAVIYFLTAKGKVDAETVKNQPGEGEPKK